MPPKKKSAAAKAKIEATKKLMAKKNVDESEIEENDAEKPPTGKARAKAASRPGKLNDRCFLFNEKYRQIVEFQCILAHGRFASSHEIGNGVSLVRLCMLKS